jgi:NitT/TauT family transport system permease protein/taurine transport system permease protein
MSGSTVIRLAVIVAFLLIWEGVRRFNVVSSLLLASPSDIVMAAVQSGGRFLTAFELTVLEIIAGIAIAFALGVAVGAVAGMSTFLSAVSGPLLASLFAVPLITWYPLFMVWFGIGAASKIAYGVVSGFCPIAINTMNSIRNFDRRFLVYGRSIGCSRREIVFRILFPLALPSIVAGLRIGLALVIIGIVVAEMLASLGGIGFLITTYSNYYKIGEVYLGIVLALLCALVANAGLNALERRFTLWRELEATTK